MAPEQATGGGIDERADVFALAAVTYQLLTGRVAHAGSLADLASLQLPPPPSELADLPTGVDEIVLRGLEPDREERWADVRSFVNALQAVVPGSGRTLLVSPPAMPRYSGSSADDPVEERSWRLAALPGPGLPRGLPGLLRRAPSCSPRPSAAEPSRDRADLAVGSTRGRAAHYPATWVAPPLAAPATPPSTRVARPKEANRHVCRPLRTRPGPRTRLRRPGRRLRARRPEHEQVVFCQRPRHRPQGDHRDPLHGPRPRPRRHPLLPLRRRPPTRSRDVLNLSRGMSYKAALAGLDLGGGKAVIIGDPATRQDRGAAARLRPLRAVAGRPLLHRLRRRHLLRGHGRRRPRVRLRHRPHRRPRRRRRLARCSRRTASSRACAPPPRRLGRTDASAGRTVGVAGVGKVGRHLVRHLVEDGATVVVTDVHQPAVDAGPRGVPRRSRAVADTDALVARRARRLRAVRAGRRAHRRGRRRADRDDRLRRGQQPARPPGHREGARRTAGSSTPPTTA